MATPSRAFMSERSLTVVTVVRSAAIAANTPVVLTASQRANMSMGEILGATYLDWAAGAAQVVLTPSRGTAITTVAAGDIQLNDATRVESGTAKLAATDLLVMQVRAGFTSGSGAAVLSEPGTFTESAKMTERGLAIFPVIWSGVAIVQNAATAIPAGLRGGMNMGEIVSAWSSTTAGVVTSFTIVAPGVAAPGANSIRLSTAAANTIFLDVAGGNLILTSIMVIFCRAGHTIGPGYSVGGTAKMTEKGLAEFFMIYTGGDQAAGVYVGATTQAIPAAMRAGYELSEIISADIHDHGTGAITNLAVVTATPTIQNQIQLVAGTSFIRGAATPADDIPADDAIFMHVRAGEPF